MKKGGTNNDESSYKKYEGTGKGNHSGTKDRYFFVKVG